MGEQELRQAVATLDAHRAQLESLARQEEILRLSLEEHVRARETIIRYSKTERGTEVLMPVGANSFLFAQVGDNNRCIVGIGSDIAIEGSVEKAIEKLDNRIKQLSQIENAVLGRMGELEQKIGEYSSLVQQEYEKLQRAQGESPEA